MSGSQNAVPGHPGWYFGLVVRHDDGVTFDIYHDDGRKIEGVKAGRYRLTSTAAVTGDRLPSWEQAAADAIVKAGKR